MKGIDNILPDALSRLYHDQPKNDLKDESFEIMAINITEQLQNPEETLNIEGETPIIPSSEPMIEKDNNLTDHQKAALLTQAHQKGHFGANTIYKQLRLEGYLWDNMYTQCIKLVQACQECQRYNIGKHGFHPPTTVNVLLPFDHMGIDLKEMVKTPRGYRYILVVIDYATRFCFLRALNSKSAPEVASTLLTLFCDFGFPTE